MFFLVMAAVAGAFIFGGLNHRANARRSYWQQMNYYAELGNQADERPRIEAGRRTANLNANIAIGVGVFILVTLIL